LSKELKEKIYLANKKAEKIKREKHTPLIILLGWIFAKNVKESEMIIMSQKGNKGNTREESKTKVKPWNSKFSMSLMPKICIGLNSIVLFIIFYRKQEGLKKLKNKIMIESDSRNL
jgi:hypothetical protein